MASEAVRSFERVNRAMVAYRRGQEEILVIHFEDNTVLIRYKTGEPRRKTQEKWWFRPTEDGSVDYTSLRKWNPESIRGLGVITVVHSRMLPELGL